MFWKPAPLHLVVDDGRRDVFVSLGEALYVIGSSNQVQIRVAESTVSERHAQLEWSQRSRCYYLRHTQGCNPSFVEGVQLQPDLPVPVRPGQLMQLGLLRLIIVGKVPPKRRLRCLMDGNCWVCGVKLKKIGAVHLQCPTCFRSYVRDPQGTLHRQLSAGVFDHPLEPAKQA